MKHFYVTRVLDELVAGLHYCLHVCYKVFGVEVLQVSYGMLRSALDPAETQVKTAHTGGLPVDGVQPIHILFFSGRRKERYALEDQCPVAFFGAIIHQHSNQRWKYNLEVDSALCMTTQERKNVQKSMGPHSVCGWRRGEENAKKKR